MTGASSTSPLFSDTIVSCCAPVICGTGTPGRTGLGGQQVQVLSCSSGATVISLNQGPATSIRSPPPDAWAVAAA
jgi:hypothetical protein